MKRLARTVSLLVSCCTLGTGTASAAVTVYYDRAAFEAAVGPHATYTFEPDQGFPAAPGRVSTFGPVTAWSRDVGTPAYVRPWPEDSGNQTLSGLYDDIGTGHLLLEFDPPQPAVGFDMYPFVSSGIAYAEFADGSFESFEVLHVTDSVAFLGLTASPGIVGLRIENNGDGRSQRYKGIDNLTIVPEPIVSVLMALLAACGLRRTAPRRPLRDSRRGSYRCEPLDSRLLLAVTLDNNGTYQLSPGTEVNTTYTPALHADRSQAEQAIAVDPTNPSRMFVFANDGRPSSHISFSGMFAAYSVDAGANWHFMDTDGLVGTAANDDNDPFQGTSMLGDPSAAFDQFGNLFIAYLESTSTGRTLTVALSTDGGQTVEDTWRLNTGPDVDQPTVVVGPGSRVNPSDPDEVPAPGSVWVTYAVSVPREPKSSAGRSGRKVHLSRDSATSGPSGKSAWSPSAVTVRTTSATSISVISPSDPKARSWSPTRTPSGSGSATASTSRSTPTGSGPAGSRPSVSSPGPTSGHGTLSRRTRTERSGPRPASLGT